MFTEGSRCVMCSTIQIEIGFLFSSKTAPHVHTSQVKKLDPISFAKFRSLHQRLYIAKSELLAREALPGDMKDAEMI